VCAVAYGQTGSGKTYSMMGTPDEPGVTPRVAAAIFERAEALRSGGDDGETSNLHIRASYLQIHREAVQDLLAHDPTASLPVRRDPKLGPYVQVHQSTASRRPAHATCRHIGCRTLPHSVPLSARVPPGPLRHLLSTVSTLVAHPLFRRVCRSGSVGTAT
jgi:hypothetical protein